jgi:isopenicillin N synthase-like dioxygenase
MLHGCGNTLKQDAERGTMSEEVVPIIDVGPFLAGDPVGRRAIPQAVARACE